MAWNPNIPTVTSRVQDDLDAIRENFQHLDPLAQAVGELQTVSGLAPYVQALLDSRIVEMGSNSNGTYVRWENGLQVCWWEESGAHNHPNATGPIYRSNIITWTYPASFVSAPVVVAGASNLTWASEHIRGLSSSSLISFSPDASTRQATIRAIAIGRWK